MSATATVCRSKREPPTVERYSRGAGGAARVDTPMPVGQQVEGQLLEGDAIATYRRLVGGLQWLANSTQPDISYATGVLGRAAAPTTTHMRNALRVLTYVAHTRERGLRYQRGDGRLSGFADADFGGCHETRCSTTGFVVQLAGAAVAWGSARQRAAGKGAREAVRCCNILEALGDRDQRPVRLWVDNQPALHIINDRTANKRIKHVEFARHCVRSLVEEGQMVFAYMRSADNAADFLTKPARRRCTRHAAARLGWCEAKKGGASETHGTLTFALPLSLFFLAEVFWFPATRSRAVSSFFCCGGVLCVFPRPTGE